MGTAGDVNCDGYSDVIVMRHKLEGTSRLAADISSVPIINAGDGAHEHPTQGLLDIMTMRQRLGDLRGRKVTIIGDIAHSRVLTHAFTRAGIATWSLEYRRIGDPGGGWPGTFSDIADGIDHLKQLAERHRLDLKRIITLGHSAGGHLVAALLTRDWSALSPATGFLQHQAAGRVVPEFLFAMQVDMTTTGRQPAPVQGHTTKTAL